MSTVAENQLDLILMEIDVDLIVSFTRRGYFCLELSEVYRHLNFVWSSSEIRQMSLWNPRFFHGSHEGNDRNVSSCDTFTNRILPTFVLCMLESDCAGRSG